jgi:hypothetical protein
VTADQVCKEIIWNNSYIRINNEPIRYQNWLKHGIKFVYDLLNEEGEIASKRYLENKYKYKCKGLEYESLAHAIPTDWRKLINFDFDHHKHYVFGQHVVHINRMPKIVEEISTKDVYWSFIDKVGQRPTSEKKWVETRDLDPSIEEWAIIYKMPYALTKNTKVITFHYKITHRILTCQTNLHTWKIEKDDICDMCAEHVDTIEHYLIECKHVLNFWESIYKWWTANSGIMFPLYTYETLFGMPNEQEDIVLKQFNYVLPMANYFVYRKRKAKEEI